MTLPPGGERKGRARRENREFQSLRAQTVLVLSALAQQGWERVGLHPKRGEFSIAANAVMHVAHDANHVARLRVLRE